MLCPSCGKTLADGAKFCPLCGAQMAGSPMPPSGPETPSYDPGGSAAPPSAPSYNYNPGSTVPLSASSYNPGGSAAPPPYNYNPGGSVTPPVTPKKPPIALIGGIVGAVAVAVAAVAMVVTGVFASPKGKVERAVVKTAAAYTAAVKKAGSPDLSKLVQDRAFSESFRVQLNSVNEDLLGYRYDASMLEGLGMSMSADYNQSKQKMDMEIAALFEKKELASIQMTLDGSKVLVASPEFTKKQVYGLDTAALGKDLVSLGVGGDMDEAELKKIGFNIFELMEKTAPSQEQNKEMAKIMAEALKELVDEIEVEKAGKESIEVNGKDVNAAVYEVVIPKSALKDYVDAMTDAAEVVDSKDMMKELLLDMGFSKSTVNEILAEYDGVSDSYSQTASLMKEYISAIGDIELEVYVSGGRVCAVQYARKIDSSKLTIWLYLGGEGNYVDDLSLEVSVDKQRLLTVESTGNHTGKGGEFTDETTVRIYNGSSDMRITSELSYEPKSSDGNFEWDIKADSNGSIHMEGQLNMGKDSVDLKLDDLSIKAAGTEIISLELDCCFGPSKGAKSALTAPKKLLGDMDEDDLRDLVYDVQDNARDWLADLGDTLSISLFSFIF